MKSSPTKTILGIDPGTNTTGYGVLEVQGSTLRCVALGDIDLRKLTDPYTKLKFIFDQVSRLLASYHPDEVALESPFFGENVQSMLKLGRAQGVAMAAALHAGCPVAEYAPRRIKQAITGSGSASKEQVAGVLKAMLKLSELPKRLDATDGLAVALCHHFQSTSLEAQSPAPRKKALGGGRSSKSWESFLSENPDRIKK